MTVNKIARRAAAAKRFTIDVKKKDSETYMRQKMVEAASLGISPPFTLKNSHA